MKQVLLLSLSLSCLASVWPTYNEWTDYYKEDFEQWVKNQVTTTMFTDKTSPYFGINVDCADVTYALKAVYAYENNLPYKVKNPVYRSGHKYKYWSNDFSKFDRYQEGLPRFIRFVNFLGDSLGTETLNAYDSYPLNISDVSAGDFYAYKKKKDGGFQRHAYNILDVTDTGNFRLIWSNQQRKEKGSPMKEATWSKLSNRPVKYSWGFRRMNFPSDYDIKKDQRSGYGVEQFELAKKMSEYTFFKHVKDTLKLYDEDPNENLKRQLNNICDQAKERVGVIKESEDYRSSIGGRCMNYKEYDDYSTPSRDGRFLGLYERLEETYQEYLNDGLQGRIDTQVINDIESIIGQNVDTRLCEVQYTEGSKKLSLKEIYLALKAKKLSKHPNDNIHRRWGVQVGKKTTCKAWY